MSEFADLFARPDPLTDATAELWFLRIATRLLCGTELTIGGRPHRPTEIEIYYHGDGHADPFAHKDPAQLNPCRWYFHRTGGQYRSGSFKGVDIAFGDGKAFAGILIRGIETPEGRLIDGPSLTVDYILAANATKSVLGFDEAIAGRRIDDATSPLHLRWVPIAPHEMVRCPRVGLTLKRATADTGHDPFLMRDYRWLTEPKRIAKGKVHMVLGLHAAGKTADEIRALTGTPGKSIAAYLEDVAGGEAGGEYGGYRGSELATKDLCRLYGMGRAKRG